MLSKRQVELAFCVETKQSVEARFVQKNELRRPQNLIIGEFFMVYFKALRIEPFPNRQK